MKVQLMNFLETLILNNSTAFLLDFTFQEGSRANHFLMIFLTNRVVHPGPQKNNLKSYIYFSFLENVSVVAPRGTQCDAQTVSQVAQEVPGKPFRHIECSQRAPLGNHFGIILQTFGMTWDHDLSRQLLASKFQHRTTLQTLKINKFV